MTLSRTFTRTHNATVFADPYKQCEQCGNWIDGALDAPGPLVLVPCEHEANYRDVCPSWGPVDGCTCAAVSGIVDHPVRFPAAGDDRRY